MLRPPLVPRAATICLLAVALSIATIEARAIAEAPREADIQATRHCHAAAAFLHETTADARRALCTDPGARPALAALGEVLERNSVPRDLLRAVISNPHAKPYLADALRALRQVDRVPGVLEVLGRMARARDDGGQRGGSFELVASACVRDRLRCMGTVIKGNEIDGVLQDGTVVEMKNRRGGFIGKAQHQLLLRSEGRFPTMLMVPAIDQVQLASLREGALRDRLSLKVLVVDASSLTAREVLAVDGRLKREPTVAPAPQPLRADPWRKLARSEPRQPRYRLKIRGSFIARSVSPLARRRPVMNASCSFSLPSLMSM